MARKDRLYWTEACSLARNRRVSSVDKSELKRFKRVVQVFPLGTLRQPTNEFTHSMKLNHRALINLEANRITIGGPSIVYTPLGMKNTASCTVDT